MNYNSEKVTGDAGEHYFAYWIINNFNYPCRLLDKDLGIDAKIEIVDADQNTTGEFIFVQIKSSDTDPVKHNIKLRHLLYWESISIPVILVGIDLSTDDIYWLHINEENVLEKYKKRALNNKDNDTTINISNDGELLYPFDKHTFETLRFKHIIPKFEDSVDYVKSATDSLIDKYGNVTDYESFVEAVSYSISYHEVVVYYILDVDWLITYTKSIKYFRKEYSDIVNHLNEYTIDEITELLEQDVIESLKIIDKTNDFMEEYISDSSVTSEDKQEVLRQLSNYDSLQSQEAQNLVNLVNGSI